MPHRIVDATAQKAGGLLSTLTAGLSSLRPAAKPLHPEGRLYGGRLVRVGSDDPVGVPWLDDPGSDRVLVRISRAVGLPGALPDIHGLALRFPLGATECADVLFATTGWNRVGRHLLLPGWSPARPMTTLLPYRSPAGPVVLGVRPVDERRFRLWWALAGHSWHPLGELVIDDGPDPDEAISFDPVAHPVPGLEQYPWVVRLRERSYATARASRS